MSPHTGPSHQPWGHYRGDQRLGETCLSPDSSPQAAHPRNASQLPPQETGMLRLRCPILCLQPETLRKSGRTERMATAPPNPWSILVPRHLDSKYGPRFSTVLLLTIHRFFGTIHLPSGSLSSGKTNDLASIKCN